MRLPVAINYAYLLPAVSIDFKRVREINMRFPQASHAALAWLNHCKSAGHSVNTMRQYKQAIGLFVKWSNGRCGPMASLLHEYAEHAYSSVSVNTAGSYLRPIRAAARWEAGENGHPLPSLRIPSQRGLPRARMIEDITRVLKNADPHTAMFIGFLLDTGLRIAEALRVRVGDLDVERRAIVIRGKGGTIRSVGCGNMMCDQLLHIRRILPVDWHVFPLRAKSYRRRIRLVCEEAGLPRLTPHQLRHSAARLWFLHGGDIANLQAVLGHATSTMVLHYARMYGNDAVRRQQELSPVDRMN